MFPHPKEVFLCHSGYDREFANKIAELLWRHNIPVWHAPANIRGGQTWHDEIGDALERCDWFVILLSPHSLKSVWVKRELVFALTEERYNESIVPVVLHACNHRRFSWTLPSRQLVDFTQDFDDGCRALLRIWGIGYRPVDPAA